MTDFNVGDRVGVVGNINPGYFSTDHIGDTGTVVEIGLVDDTYGNCWGVKSDTDGEVRFFYEGELKKWED